MICLTIHQRLKFATNLQIMSPRLVESPQGKSMLQNGKSVDLASQNQIDPINASVDVIVEYLIVLFREKQCQVNTIEGYRSIISKP